jgi:hypothetical protein
VIGRMILYSNLDIARDIQNRRRFGCLDLSVGSSKNELSRKLAKKIQVEKERSKSRRTRLYSSVAIEGSGKKGIEGLGRSE